MKYNIKEKLRGWRRVYLFTTAQALKGKSMLVSLIILAVIIIASMPLVTLISSGEDNIEITQIETAYFFDESGYGLLSHLPEAMKDDYFSASECVEIASKADYNTLAEAMSGEDYDEDNVLLSFYFDPDMGTYIVRVVYPESSSLSEIAVNIFAEDIMGIMSRLIYLDSGFDDETIERIEAPIETSVVTLGGITSGEGDEVDDEHDISDGPALTEAEYSISYGGIIVVTLFIAMSGELIANSIVTEKANRVTEYLMTSIRPLALIFGKVLSGLTVMLVQVAVIAASFMVSILLENAISGKSGLPEFIEKALTAELLAYFTPTSLILCIIMLALGFIFFGVVAGLAGASVSRVEDTAEGLKLYTFSMVIGAYIGMANVIFALFEPGSAFEWFSLLFPLSSPFIMPAYLLIGRATITTALIASAVMIIAIILLCLFVAKVYEDMIFYNGSILRLKDIIKMAKKGERKNG